MSFINTWGADAPAVGAYKDNDVAEVFKPAAYASLFFQLADKRSVKAGQSLTVPAYEQLTFPTTTALDENEAIPLSKLTISAKTISMNERGRAVAVTGKSLNRSPFDLLQAHKDDIQEMMRRELEEVIATALKTMPIKYVATGAAAQTITTNGTAGASAAANPNIYHMQNIGMYLQDTIRVPMDPRYGSYVGIFRGNGIFSIQRDPEWRELHRGTGLTSIDTLQSGKIGDITLFKHNDQRVLANNIGGSSNVSEGLIFGKQAVLFGFIEQIGLKYDFSESKATDFGRFKYIAWMGDYGAGIYSDVANSDLARGIHYTST